MTVNVPQLIAGLLLLLYATTCAQMTSEENAGRYVCRWCKKHYNQPIQRKTGKGKQVHLACPRCHKFL